MEEKDKDLIMIEIKDDCSFCFQDKLQKGSSSSRSPKGYVHIFSVDKDGNKEEIGKPNLVLNKGREWLLTRSFNIENPSISSSKDEFICWMGLGDGGATIADPFNPIPPANMDIDLNNEVPINPTDITCADYRSGYYYKHPLGAMDFEQDIDNDNSYLILRITTTIGFEDCNDYLLNEAALFTNLSNEGGSVAPFNIYSKVTFPTTPKNVLREIILVWYIYF